MIKRIFEGIIFCAVLYGLLYWAASNPNSVKSVKNTVDKTAAGAVDSLTDDK
mgnify:CR=1 FL=1